MTVLDRFRLDDQVVVVTGASSGLGTAYPASRETPEQFRQVIDINLNGASATQRPTSPASRCRSTAA